MHISAIVAIDEAYGMGKNNQLPWHLPDDLKFFMRTTMGMPVIMGRKTYDSMGKPLKGRLNIVLSRKPQADLPPDVLVFDNTADAMACAAAENKDEIFIIGGAEIFKLCLEQVDTLYITKVHTVIDDADTFFPHIDHSHWKQTWSEAHSADEKHLYAFTFQKWERLREI